MTPQCYTFICLSLLISVSEQFMLDTQFIKHVLGQFTIVNPIISTTKHDEVRLVKLFSSNDQMTRVVNLNAKTVLEKDGLCSKMLVVQDITEINLSNFFVGDTCPVLVLITADDDLMDTVLSSVQIDINQKVYFLSSITNQVFETYTVNNIRIIRKMGMFEAVLKTSTISFNPEPGVETDFVQRRSNFQGVTLKAMVQDSEPYLVLQPNYESIGKFLKTHTIFDCSDVRSIFIHYSCSNY
jgi:hypothetical protein